MIRGVVFNVQLDPACFLIDKRIRHFQGCRNERYGRIVDTKNTSNIRQQELRLLIIYLRVGVYSNMLEFTE